MGEAMALEKTCCVTGYRPRKLPFGYREQDQRCIALKAALLEQIEAAVQEGYTRFLTGMAEGVDLFFAEQVLLLKSRGMPIRLEAVVPCPDQCARWIPAQKARYHRIFQACDWAYLVSERYSKDCMMKRNRFMVDHSDRVIAVFDGQPGGTARTVAYAEQRGRQVIVLWPME